MSFNDLNIYSWLVVSLLIFFARIIDVTIGTLRIIFVSRGKRYLAPLLGFFESLIWLLAIGQIMNNLTNFSNYFAYAAGFSAGNYIGIMLEEKLAMGLVSIRIITNQDAVGLINYLKEENYGLTSIEGRGVTGDVILVYSIVRRKDLKKVINSIKDINPKSFITIEDIRSVNAGVFPTVKFNRF